MGRLRAIPFHIKLQRFLRARKYILIISSLSFISTFILTTIIYLNVDHVVDLFSYIDLSLSSSNEQPIQAKSTNLPSKKGLSIIDRKITYQDFNYLDSTSLTYENRTYANNLEILFRLPKKRSIFGLLLIFHGCSRSAHDYFHTIERQRIVGGAIDLGYACLAFQAINSQSQCWSNTADIYANEDIQRVFTGLDHFYKEFPELASLPRFTFGASSGGVFSSIFAVNPRYPIQGQILFISIILPEVLETYVKANNYPATVWIYMPRDTEFASSNRINGSMKIFARENISHTVFDIEPLTLIPNLIHERIPTISSDTSHYLFYRLQQNHWIDSDNYLNRNPRRDHAWKIFLFEMNNETTIKPSVRENLHHHKNILAEFLNIIYGEHEISFEHSFEALTWLKQHSTNKIVSNTP